MTMPSSGTIDLQDAALEFYGGTGGGTGGLNADAAGAGFLLSSGTSTLGVSVRNSLNASVPTAAPISLQSLYGASGANVTSLALTAGTASSGSFSTSSAVITVTNASGLNTHEITVSIPSGLTISSIGTSSLTFVSGSGSMAFNGGWSSVTANTWKRAINSGPTLSTVTYTFSATITDSASRVRTVSCNIVEVP